MKEKILAALRENKTQYISGNSLSEMLGCSRTAIWKHIIELREQGYRIESSHRKGYRLVTDMEQVDTTQWVSMLRTKRIGKMIHYVPEVDSTQIIAHQLAREGKSEGCCVIANRQTGGKGRLGRTWHSPAGVGLWTSVILRPQLPIESVAQMTLVCAAAVAKTLAKFGYSPVIKWPNDILLDGKKVCGILTELQGDFDQVKYMIVGIGINIAHRIDDFDPEIRDLATSLYLVDPANTPSRSQLFAELCYQMEVLYSLYLEHGFTVVRPIWEAYAMSTSQTVKVHTMKTTFVGKVRGITDKGVLLVETDTGEIEEIVSADIEIYTDKK